MRPILPESIFLLWERAPSVCVSVYLFRISSQTAGWINFKLSQKMPLASPLKLVDISSRFDKPILHIFGILYHFLHQCLNWWLSDWRPICVFSNFTYIGYQFDVGVCCLDIIPRECETWPCAWNILNYTRKIIFLETQLREKMKTLHKSSYFPENDHIFCF